MWEHLQNQRIFLKQNAIQLGALVFVIQILFMVRNLTILWPEVISERSTCSYFIFLVWHTSAGK